MNKLSVGNFVSHRTEIKCVHIVNKKYIFHVSTNYGVDDERIRQTKVTKTYKFNLKILLIKIQFNDRYKLNSSNPFTCSSEL